MTWLVMQRSVWNDIVRRTRLRNNSTKVSTPCIDDHHFKEEETKSVGELSNTCSQIDLKCLHLARIGRLDILLSVNKIARSITKWTKACDKRLNRLISNIHHTCECKQHCHVGNTAEQCRFDCFTTLISREILKIQNLRQGEHCVFSEVIHFVTISWMCFLQTSVSHSSKSEIIFLDTGPQLDSLPALELWDLIVSVFGNISHISNRTGQPVNGKNKFYDKIDVMHDIDHVLSNVQSSNQET